MTKLVDQGWQLQALSIDKEWNAEAYRGRIRFRDGKSQELSFNIPPDKVRAMMELVSESIMQSARELGAGLLKSIQPPSLPALSGGSEDFIPGEAASGELG